MDVNSALQQRKSVRAFLAKEVNPNLIKEILDGARWSPSGTNTQPWQVAVVSGNTKQNLDKTLLNLFEKGTPKNPDYNYYPQELTQEFKQRRLACGLQMYSTLNIDRSNSKQRLQQWGLNYIAFGAPTTLYFFAHKIIEKGSFMDLGMFIQSVMLMATSKGLATCPQAALAEYPDTVRHILGYSNEFILLAGMAIGYEDKKAIVNSYRTPREEVKTFTKFYE